MTDHQQRAADLVAGGASWDSLNLAERSNVRRVAAALEQATTEARADIVRAVEALIVEWGRDAANTEFHVITRELSNQHVYRLRAVLAAAVTPDGGQR